MSVWAEFVDGKEKNTKNKKILVTPDDISLPRIAQAMCRSRKTRDQEDLTALKYTPVETERFSWITNYMTDWKNKIGGKKSTEQCIRKLWIWDNKRKFLVKQQSRYYKYILKEKASIKFRWIFFDTWFLLFFEEGTHAHEIQI